VTGTPVPVAACEPVAGLLLPVAGLLLPVTGLLLPVAGPALVVRVGAQAAPGGSCWPVRWVDTIDGD
jgi:hypothetical protein